MSRAVNTLAVWIEEVFGLGSGDNIVGYTGINDIRYPTVILALLKLGYKINTQSHGLMNEATSRDQHWVQSFLISPRNSREETSILLNSARCNKFMFSPEYKDLA
jgi:hypothetical protein